MCRCNFPGPANADERGILFPDHTDDKKLTQLLRRMRHYNPIPNTAAYGGGYRNLPVTHLVEDPSFRESAHSYFIQAVDLAAYLIYQGQQPNHYMRTKGGRSYYRRLGPIVCRAASPSDAEGFVRL